MKFKPVKLAPALIAVCVIVLISLARLLHPDVFERLEWMTYDMRAREAVKFAPTVSTNFGFVFISDDTIDRISKGLLGKRYGLYWPRQVTEVSSGNSPARGPKPPHSTSFSARADRMMPPCPSPSPDGPPPVNS